MTGGTGIGTSFENCIDDEVYDTNLKETIKSNCDNSESVPATRELSEHQSDMLTNLMTDSRTLYTHCTVFTVIKSTIKEF